MLVLIRSRKWICDHFSTSINNADPALYDVFWLDRGRHRACLQQSNLQPRCRKQCRTLGGVRVQSSSSSCCCYYYYYSATPNNMTLVHWPLMGGLLHLVYSEEGTGRTARPGPSQMFYFIIRPICVFIRIIFNTKYKRQMQWVCLLDLYGILQWSFLALYITSCPPINGQCTNHRIAV